MGRVKKKYFNLKKEMCGKLQRFECNLSLSHKWARELHISLQQNCKEVAVFKIEDLFS